MEPQDDAAHAVVNLATTLAPELLAHVLLQLPRPFSYAWHLATASRVCAAWRDAFRLESDRLWQAFVERDYPHTLDLMRVAYAPSGDALHQPSPESRSGFYKVLHRRQQEADGLMDDELLDELDDYHVVVELYGAGSGSREMIGCLDGTAEDFLSIGSTPFKISPLTERFGDVPLDLLLEHAYSGLSCRMLVSLEVEGASRTVILYDDCLADFSRDEDEWCFEWGNISDCSAPDGISLEGGIDIFLYPVLHPKDGSFTFEYHGSTEMGWSLEHCGRGIDEDLHIRRLLGTGIPWNRVPEGRPYYNPLIWVGPLLDGKTAPLLPEAIPCDKLRPMSAAHASNAHLTWRKTDLFLTVELLDTAGRLLLSHSSHASRMLSDDRVILHTTPEWLTSASPGELSCRVLVSKKLEDLELRTALIYPADLYGLAQGTLETVPIRGGPTDGEWTFTEATYGGGWVGPFASVWMHLTPKLRQRAARRDGEADALRVSPAPHDLADGAIEICFDFSTVSEAMGFHEDFNDKDTILDWFDDGIPWHRADKKRLGL